jgi:hypothetical protein
MRHLLIWPARWWATFEHDSNNIRALKIAYKFSAVFNRSGKRVLTLLAGAGSGVPNIPNANSKKGPSLPGPLFSTALPGGGSICFRR